MTEETVKLGDRVKDDVTGYQGVVVEVCHFITGETRYGVQAKMREDGSIPGIVYFDAMRLLASVRDLAVIKASSI